MSEENNLPTPSVVEETLSAQRDHWKLICERALSISHRDLPPEAPRRILLFGVGSSHYAAKLTAFAMIRDHFRQRVPVVSCASQEIGVEVIPQKGDFAIAFSHRGRTEITREAMEICSRAGAFVIQVSGENAAEAPATRLLITTTPQEKVEPHTASVTGAVCAVTTLILGTRAAEEWEALRSLGNPDLDRMRMKAGTGPTILLGEWEGEWLAHEGALKLMEMAKLPVRSYGSEEFFHGPHTALTSEDRVWHIALPEDPRAAQIAQLRPAHRIGVMASSPLAWMPALVELQWLALATALNRGVDPDAVRA